MDTGIAHAGINIGAFLLVTSGVLLLFQEPGTAEFIITAITAVIGLVFTLGVVLVVKLTRK